jgi:sulfatase-modifying factor enzyme 1
MNRSMYPAVLIAIAGSALACSRETAQHEPPAPIASSSAPVVAVPAPSPSATHAPAPPSPCPGDMVLVEGMYCPQVEQTCRHYLGAGRFRTYSCARYRPTKCLSKQRKTLRFCMDRFEYTPPGESLPRNHVSFDEASASCEELGKRICVESEWNFACEGDSILPYPYGLERDPTACNTDRIDLTGKDGRALIDHRTPSGSLPRCVSPFGIYDMAGNLEELVARDDFYRGRPAMKGSWWLPSRHNCRARQKTHGPKYTGIEVGFRCCAEAGE